MSSKLQLTATFATIETRGELDRVTFETFAKTSRAITKDREKNWLIAELLFPRNDSMSLLSLLSLLPYCPRCP